MRRWLVLVLVLLQLLSPWLWPCLLDG